MENWLKLCKMSTAEIKKMQERKLRDLLINQIYPYSPYYSKIFKKNNIDPYKIKRIEDLRHIPFTYKEDVAPTDENPTKHKDFVVRPDEEISEKYSHMVKLSPYGGKRVIEDKTYEYKPVHIHFTTGRTAKSTPFVYSLRDLENIKEAGYRLLNVFGLTTEGFFINAFPYSPHLAFWQSAFAAESGGFSGLNSGGGKVIGTQNLIDAVEEFKATAMVVIPGYAYYMLREAARQKRDFSSMCTIVFGGERVPPGLKTKIRALLTGMGAKDPVVLATYGLTEARTAWGECPAEESFGYHTYPDMAVIEIINPETGEPVEEGEEGEIVCTPLDWRGTCVLRYRTGDIAKGGITYEPCPNCGRNVPRISADIQRKSEFKEFDLTKIKGTLVNLNNFFPLLMSHPQVLEWQVELRKRNNDPFELDEIYLYIAPTEGSDLEKLKTDLRQKVIRDTEVAPSDIIFKPVKEILKQLGMETELKEKRIFDNRPKV